MTRIYDFRMDDLQPRDANPKSFAGYVNDHIVNRKSLAIGRLLIAQTIAVILAALLLASCGGHTREVKPAGEGPDLEIAILTCNFDRVKALVDEDPTIIDVKPPNRYQYPIAIAANSSRICGTKTFSYLLDQDPQMNVILLTDALRAAARISDVEMVNLLLKHGADPNGGDGTDDPSFSRNETPLRVALGNWLLSDPARNLAVAETLVAAGARLDVPAAAAMGKTKALRSMLQRDPKLAVQHKRYAEWKPMDWAQRYRQRESARVLLEFIPNPSLRDLIIAGDERAVRDYLDHHPGVAKLKVEDDDYERDYPITVAARAGDKEIVKLLLDRGADPNTLWMMEEVIRRGDADMVKFLIEHGADVKDKPGRERLTDVAVAAKHPELADIIRQAQ